MARARSPSLAAVLALATVALLCSGAATFIAAAPRAPAAVGRAAAQPGVVGMCAALAAAVPLPAHAGGMFDFGLTLPFVAGTFLLMMVVLNALWYSPVLAEMDDRSAKLLKTLSDATDMLTKADEMQVTYTEKIRAAREKASKALSEYRSETEKRIQGQVAATTAERNQRADGVRAKLDAEVDRRIAAAEGEIEKRKAAFVQETLAKMSLA